MMNFAFVVLKTGLSKSLKLSIDDQKTLMGNKWLLSKQTHTSIDRHCTEHFEPVCLHIV